MNFKELLDDNLSKADEPITLLGGSYFDYLETLQRINAYSNSNYVEGEHDDTDIFWNLGATRVPHFIKNIDLDTKNLNPYPKGKTNFWQVWVLKMKFYKWKQENGFAITIDDMVDSVAENGSAVWKIIKKDNKKTIDIVNLENLYFDRSVKYIKDSPYFIEKHELTEYEVMKKSDVWDNIDELLDEKNLNENGKYDIYEFWGEVEEKGKIKYKQIICSDAGEDGIVLVEFEEKKENFPYYDFHIGKYKGRWLRVGIYERLFNLQVRANKLCNENAQTTAISSLLIMKSQEAGMAGGNIINQLENGTILNTGDLQQVGMDNRNLSSFLQELALIERQADRLCMTPEVITGEDLPNNITFRGQAQLVNSAKNAFKQTRDGLGENISSILLKQIFPDLIKDWNVEEVIDYIEDEDDIYIYDALYKERKFNEKLFELVLANIDPMSVDPSVINLMVDNEDINDRKLMHGKDFFNFEYGIRLNVTGEGVDKAQKNDAYNNALQWIMQAPQIQDNPYFKQYLEFNNISARKIKGEQLKPQAGQSPKPIGQKDKLSALVNTQ